MSTRWMAAISGRNTNPISNIRAVSQTYTMLPMIIVTLIQYPCNPQRTVSFELRQSFIDWFMDVNLINIVHTIVVRKETTIGKLLYVTYTLYLLPLHCTYYLYTVLITFTLYLLPLHCRY